jgi:hypothetical protein
MGSLDLSQMLRETITKLRSDRENPAAKWFALSAALGQPTRTGSLGETMGNVGAAMSKYESDRTTAERQRMADLLSAGVKLYDVQQTVQGRLDAQAEKSTRPATAEELAAYGLPSGTSAQVTNGKLEVITPPRGQTDTEYTAQVLRKASASGLSSLTPAEQAVYAKATQATRPTESNILAEIETKMRNGQPLNASELKIYNDAMMKRVAQAGPPVGLPSGYTINP